MLQVFISHGIESDGDFAQNLAHSLRETGAKVWIAPTSIGFGLNPNQAIEEGIVSSSHFLLIASPLAMESRSVQQEIDIALDLWREGKLKILVVRRHNCSLPRMLRSSFQWADYKEGYIDQLIRDLPFGIEDRKSIVGKLSQELAEGELIEILEESTEAYLSMFEDKTVIDYEIQVRSFLDWYREHPEISGGIGERLKCYQDHLRNKGYADSTIAIYFRRVRNLVQFVVRKDPQLSYLLLHLEEIDTPQIDDETEPIILTGEEAQLLLDTTGVHTHVRLRDTCMLGLFLTTGMWLSEVTGIKTNQISFVNEIMIIYLLGRRRHRERNVKVPYWLAAHIIQWCEIAEIDLGLPDEIVFYGTHKGGLLRKDGNGITDRSVQRIIKHRAVEAGLSELRATDLRYSAAVLCRESGARMDQIAQMLGNKLDRWSRQRLDYLEIDVDDYASDYSPLVDPGRIPRQLF